MTHFRQHRVMYNGMRKAFPGLRIVSEEFEEYDGPVTLPRLDDASLREDVRVSKYFDRCGLQSPLADEYPRRGH